MRSCIDRELPSSFCLLAVILQDSRCLARRLCEMQRCLSSWYLTVPMRTGCIKIFYKILKDLKIIKVKINQKVFLVALCAVIGQVCGGERMRRIWAKVLLFYSLYNLFCHFSCLQTSATPSLTSRRDCRGVCLSDYCVRLFTPASSVAVQTKVMKHFCLQTHEPVCFQHSPTFTVSSSPVLPLSLSVKMRRQPV